MSDSAASHDRWRAFTVCVIVAALTILDISKVNVGLPAIAESLDAGPSALQLTVAGYALTFGLALVPAGRFGDLHSRRRMFLIGLVVFAVASLACTLAPTAELLVASRLLQGLAGGILIPQVLGLTQQLFTGQDRGRAFGMFGLVIGLSVAFGPALGGLLIAAGGPDWGWRLIFLMNVPLAAVVFPIAFRLLPRTQPAPQGPRTLDPIGTLLLGLTILGLMLPFVLTTGRDSDDPARWWWLAVAAGVGALFALWERAYRARGNAPVVDFALFRIRSYRNGMTLASAYFASLPGVFLITTLFLQQGLGLAPVLAGLVTVPFALVSAWTAWRTGRIPNERRRPVVIIGVASVLAAVLATVLAARVLPHELVPVAIAVIFGIAGLGAGGIIGPNQTLTLADVPVQQGGLAGALGQVGQRFGTAVGVAISTSLFYGTISRELGSVGATTAFDDAFMWALLSAALMLAIALTVGLFDLRQRRVEAEGAPQGA